MLAFCCRGCITGPFLWAGTGGAGFNPGPAAGGLDSGGSEGDGDTPGCLVVRLGATIEIEKLCLKY